MDTVLTHLLVFAKSDLHLLRLAMYMYYENSHLYFLRMAQQFLQFVNLANKLYDIYMGKNNFNINVSVALFITSILSSLS